MYETLCLLALMSLSAPGAPPDSEQAFAAAKAVWPEGRDTEKNVFVGFRAAFECPREGAAVLRVTGATLYRAFVNGAFCGHGPARGPHGYYRVDEWDLSGLLRPGVNVIAIEAAGYNANSYYVLDQPSFLQAEVLCGGRVVAATGAEDVAFEVTILDERVQKVQRYSFQRPFIEVYRLDPTYDPWRVDSNKPIAPVTCADVGAKRLLPRRVPYPHFDLRPAVALVSSGEMAQKDLGKLWRDRSIVGVGPELGGYPEGELEIIPSFELQHLQTASKTPRNESLAADAALEIGENGFHIVDLGVNLSGFPHLEVACAAPLRLFVTFDEMLHKDDVDWRRLGCVNALTYDLAPGAYALEAFEPYTMRYLKIIAAKGACTVSNIGLRTYENPDTARAQFAAADERLNVLFEAGRTTFAQNAVDIFMDCPHRERAGWLCDSFFTARSAMALSGNTRVEQNFIENFLLPEQFAHLPEGMLPMCYPSDHYNGNFIPNWAMWFVVQLGEYLERSGDRAMVDALKPKVMKLIEYFQRFKNEDGLLEKLEAWVFVEWSAANNFVQDVNYPSNMLYAGMLSTAARLYGLSELEAEAERMRQTIRSQSFDGEFFVDNALRKEGKLEVTRNRTEVCQYFAFYFGLATPESHPELWKRLRDDFGPKRKETKAYEEVHMANSFIGNMLRVELLSRQDLSQQILDESVDYLYYMAERTGTLWENVHDNASLNHGFASHIVHTLQRDVLGAYRIDPVGREILLRFPALELAWCKGRIPIGDRVLALEWRQDGDTLTYRLEAPEGFRVSIDNRSGKTLAPADK